MYKKLLLLLLLINSYGCKINTEKEEIPAPSGINTFPADTEGFLSEPTPVEYTSLQLLILVADSASSIENILILDIDSQTDIDIAVKEKKTLEKIRSKVNLKTLKKKTFLEIYPLNKKEEVFFEGEIKRINPFIDEAINSISILINSLHNPDNLKKEKLKLKEIKKELVKISAKLDRLVYPHKYKKKTSID